MFNRQILRYIFYLLLGVIWIVIYFTRKNVGIAYTMLLILGIILVLFSIFGILNWFKNKK